MKKIALALALIMIASTAGAVQVVLLKHNVTSASGSVNTLVTDGSIPPGFAPASTVIWDWDGTMLTSTGLYSATLRIGASPFGGSIMNDQVVGLSIDTSIGTATATSYTCLEGTFLAGVGFNGCGDYSLGVNFIDESTTVWSGLSVSQTIGGDDVGGTEGPRTIAAFNFNLDGIVGVNGLNFGDQILIGNGIPVGAPGGEVMTFQIIPIPAAVWLFGSALGLLGWARHKAG